MHHSPLFYIEYTYADTVVNLRMEHDRLMCNEGMVKAAAVSYAFDENRKYITTSNRQAAYTAMGLLASVIRTLLDITKGEKSELFLRFDKFGTFGATST